MFNAKRLFGYLATGVMPERTALDAAIAIAEAMDAIDFAAHDGRYHGGKYDPDTMTCGMRQALEKGDLADVLAAENDEEREWKKYIKKRPELMTDEEFTTYFGKPCRQGQARVREYIKTHFTPARSDGGGTLIGTFDGKSAYPHTAMYSEMAGSQNARYIIRYEKSAWKDKAYILRHISEFLKTSSVLPNEALRHKPNNHSKWQIANGFSFGKFMYNGKPWYFVFTDTGDGRLLMYDIVQKEK